MYRRCEHGWTEGGWDRWNKWNHRPECARAADRDWIEWNRWRIDVSSRKPSGDCRSRSELLPTVWRWEYSVDSSSFSFSSSSSSSSTSKWMPREETPSRWTAFPRERSDNPPRSGLFHVVESAHSTPLSSDHWIPRQRGFFSDHRLPPDVWLYPPADGTVSIVDRNVLVTNRRDESGTLDECWIGNVSFPLNAGLSSPLCSCATSQVSSVNGCRHFYSSSSRLVGPGIWLLCPDWARQRGG